MKLDTIFKELEENTKNKEVMLSNYLTITKKYIAKAKEFEDAKNKVLDLSIRDSVEKQLARAYQENEMLKNLALEVDELRRTKDMYRVSFEMVDRIDSNLKAMKDIILSNK